MSCPSCESSRSFLLFKQSDYLFGLTDYPFQIRQCKDCSLRYLFPLPEIVCGKIPYPDDYRADIQAKPSLKNNLTELYRRVVLFDHIRFVKKIVREQHQKGYFTTLPRI